MRLNRVLTINQVKRQLIDERVLLRLTAPGTAQFTVVVDDAISINQLVSFDLGYSQQASLQRWFIGVTDKVVAVGNKRIKVFCRELSSILSHPLPLNLRHVDLRDVVAEINNITGINFATPDAPYTTTKVANFYNLGSGYLAMAAMARVFNINDYIWQQQSGIVYVGSWAHSRWADFENIEIPVNMLDGHNANQSARIAAIPQLRPGMGINGNRLTSVEFAQNHMTLGWGKA